MTTASYVREQLPELGAAHGWRFVIAAHDSTVRDPTFLADPLLAIVSTPRFETFYVGGDSWRESPTGTPHLTDFQFPPPKPRSLIHILAIRRDGNDLTIIRKLHRLAP